jgi:hypothetical protein
LLKMFGLDNETFFNIHTSKIFPEKFPDEESSFINEEDMLKIEL